MQEDKTLKELLLKGAVEASPDFTETVMKRIAAINTAKAGNYSIVNSRWKLIFKIAYAAISFLVIIVSFLVKPSQLPFTSFFKVGFITEQLGYKIIIYLLSFWILIFINKWIGERYNSSVR